MRATLLFYIYCMFPNQALLHNFHFGTESDSIGSDSNGSGSTESDSSDSGSTESAGFGSVEGSSGTTPFGAGSSNIISSSEPDSAETVSSNKSVATLEILLLLLLRAPLNHQLLRFPRCW